MRKCHITGCPAEEEKREGELRSRKASAFHIRTSCPLTEAGSPNKLCLTQVTGCTCKWSWFRLAQKKVVADIPATPIMPCEKRKITTENPEYGGWVKDYNRLAVFRSTFRRWDVILKHGNYAGKGYGKFLKFPKESAFMFLQATVEWFLNKNLGYNLFEKGVPGNRPKLNFIPKSRKRRDFYLGLELANKVTQ